MIFSTFDNEVGTMDSVESVTMDTNVKEGGVDG
jgi:hypothetical protein